MNNIVKTYFPNGCTICGSEITLLPDAFKYVCYNCGAYADSHRQNSKYAEKYQPTETLALEEIHFLRDKVRKAFTKLYRERLNIKANHELINTALINIIFPEHIIKMESIEGEVYAFVLQNNEDKTFTISTIEQGTISVVSENDTENITNRDKAFIWLAHKLGLNDHKCNIGKLDKTQLKAAYQYIYQATLEAKRKALESI